MNRALSIITICISIGALAWCFYIEQSRPLVGYIEMDKVFNAFQMKIELENDFQKRLDVSNERIEYMNLRKLSPDFNKDSLALINELLEKEMASVHQNMNVLKPQYDAQIQRQLSQYLMEYVASTSLDLFFTTLEGSTIIYGDSSLNHSEKAIMFINKKYEGLD